MRDAICWLLIISPAFLAPVGLSSVREQPVAKAERFTTDSCGDALPEIVPEILEG